MAMIKEKAEYDTLQRHELYRHKLEQNRHHCGRAREPESDTINANTDAYFMRAFHLI
jgi:hypothetical protein